MPHQGSSGFEENQKLKADWRSPVVAVARPESTRFGVRSVLNFFMTDPLQDCYFISCNETPLDALLNVET